MRQWIPAAHLPQDLDGPLEGRLRPRHITRLPEHEPQVVEEQADPGVGRAEHRLGDLERAFEVAPGEDVVSEALEDARPVPERLGQRGVIGPRACSGIRSARHQRQGCRVDAVIEGCSRGWSGSTRPRENRAEGLLPDRQRALDERSGLAVVVESLVERAIVGQDVASLGCSGPSTRSWMRSARSKVVRAWSYSPRSR